jgi:molybdate transport system ATP-binding protein
MLDVQLDKRLGGFRLDVTFAVDAGTTLVLVGESGSGKTTLLRLLAGLVRPDAGRVRLGDDVWLDAVQGVDVPSWRRSIGWVPQDYALFPHLTVSGNVAFGLRSAGLGRDAARDRVRAALQRLDVASLAARRPHQLSGGQQQRVALARALVLEPRLLLLDEPLAALDLQTRRAVRSELKTLLAALPCTTVFVTHSPVEALLFGDRIAVLESGSLTQSGSGDDLLRHPRSGYVAELMGVNLFQGRIVARTDGTARVETGGATIAVVDPGGEDQVFLALSPREVTLHKVEPTGSAQNLVRGRIREITPEPPFGERLRVTLDSRPPIVAEVTAAAVASMGLRAGEEVIAAFKATGVTTYR